MKNQIHVNVNLKSEILDPQGSAVLAALKKLGLVGISDVKVGRHFVLTFSSDVTAVQIEKLQYLAANFLANPVIEDSTILINHDG